MLGEEWRHCTTRTLIAVGLDNPVGLVCDNFVVRQLSSLTLYIPAGLKFAWHSARQRQRAAARTGSDLIEMDTLT